MVRKRGAECRYVTSPETNKIPDKNKSAISQILIKYTRSGVVAGGQPTLAPANSKQQTPPSSITPHYDLLHVPITHNIQTQDTYCTSRKFTQQLDNTSHNKRVQRNTYHVNKILKTSKHTSLPSITRPRDRRSAKINDHKSSAKIRLRYSFCSLTRRMNGVD